MDEPVQQTAEQCNTCKFARNRTYGEATVIECRYSDPFNGGGMAIWPQVQATDWCGKFVATTGA